MTVRAYLIVYNLIQGLTISLYIKGMPSLLRPVSGLHIAVLAAVSGRIFCGMEFSSTDFTYFLKTHLYLLAVPFIMPFLTPFLCHGVPWCATTCHKVAYFGSVPRQKNLAGEPNGRNSVQNISKKIPIFAFGCKKGYKKESHLSNSLSIS